MDIDQLKSNWKTQLERQSTKDFDNNMMTLEHNFKTLDKKVNERTLYGSIMFVVMMGAFAFQAYFSLLFGESMLTTAALTSWFIIVVISLIRILLLKQKYKQKNHDLTIAQSLAYKLSKIESEIHFNRNLIWTILLPMVFGFVLMFIDSPHSLLVNLILLLVLIVSFYISYVYNKNYVSKRLLPVRDDILANLAALSEKKQ